MFNPSIWGVLLRIKNEICHRSNWPCCSPRDYPVLRITFGADTVTLYLVIGPGIVPVLKSHDNEGKWRETSPKDFSRASAAEEMMERNDFTA